MYYLYKVYTLKCKIDNRKCNILNVDLCVIEQTSIIGTQKEKNYEKI